MAEFQTGDRPTTEQHVVMVDIARAEDEFFEALDRIAPDGITSREWLAMVRHALGGIDAYGDWVAEGWEPVDTSVSDGARRA